MCIISGSDLKVCQAFSIISPNPPPSQFATFPFAGSGKDYQADPPPFPILIFLTKNPTFYDQEPLCPIQKCSATTDLEFPLCLLFDYIG